MFISKIISKKAEGLALSPAEIEFIFRGYLEGRVSPEEMSALLMAIRLMGANAEETAVITQTMLDSGQKMSWDRRAVDKHSTGGVGDKTSFVILGLAVAEGLPVPMIAGRGLGHTGGTIDKLESIPGMSVSHSFADLVRIFGKTSCFLTSQSREIAPLDRLVYALRDRTGSVASIPLITASILAKKLSEGISHLVMNLTWGQGAFMQTEEEARKLGESIEATAKFHGVSVDLVPSDMNSPLGRSAGNWIEIQESMEILRGEAGEKKLVDLSIDLTAKMVRGLSGENLETIAGRLRSILASGKAYECFLRLVAAQNGNIDAFETKLRGPAFYQGVEIRAPRGGRVKSIDVRSLGFLLRELSQSKGPLDYEIGLDHLAHLGDQLSPGDLLGMAYVPSRFVDKARQVLLESYGF